VNEVFSCHDPAQRAAGMVAAKDSLNRSGLVVIPTDTVYGLAADAFDPTGVRRLLRAKGRGRDMPTPVLISSSEVLTALATGVTVEARELAEAFWPGGLTLIFRQQGSLRWDLGDSRGTVAVRVPNQDDALTLLGDTGPLAVSSANTTGLPAAVTVAQAREMLGDSVDVYLDAGPTSGAVPSTIVDATTEVLIVRRQGVVDFEALRAVVPTIEVAEPG
jgi:tRNA threonylcarbamoyl adenosine modification protein (Sua5/YciO/YrdC/YwlC family)